MLKTFVAHYIQQEWRLLETNLRFKSLNEVSDYLCSQYLRVGAPKRVRLGDGGNAFSYAVHLAGSAHDSL